MGNNTRHHSRDRSATNALRRVFPESWLFKNPRDVDSGREYSEDWIIEIVDEDADVEGVEFGIQNKTNPRIIEGYVCVDMAVGDMKRAIDLKRPFMLHAYDRGTKTSYWIWLHEWLATNYDPNWNDDTEPAVRIPNEQILDEEAVKLIQKYVRWDHLKRKMERLADVVNITRPNDYFVQVQTDEKATAIWTIINPKHEDAFPTLVPLNNIATSALTQAIETGRPVKVPSDGRFALENVPSILTLSAKSELRWSPWTRWVKS